MPKTLTADLAAHSARVALANVHTEYPFRATILMASDADVRTPRRLHPAFFGSYDWHSCVHMHWALALCVLRFPDLDEAPAIAAQFGARLTPAAIDDELAFFRAP